MLRTFLGQFLETFESWNDYLKAGGIDSRRAVAMRCADGFHTGGERPKAKAPPPFSLRLSKAERALLEARAGNQPLGAYMRSCLLGDQVWIRGHNQCAAPRCESPARYSSRASCCGENDHY